MSGGGLSNEDEEALRSDTDSDDSGSQSDDCEPVRRLSAEELKKLLHERQISEQRMEPVAPSKLKELRVSDDWVGKAFESRAHYVLEVAAYNESKGRLVRVKKSTSRRVSYGCRSEECTYSVAATLVLDRRLRQFTTWTVRAFQPHTCQEGGNDGRKREKGTPITNYAVKQLVPAFRHMIKDRKSMKPDTLAQLLMEYVAWTPSPIFVRRIIYGCVEARVGSDQRLHVGEEEAMDTKEINRARGQKAAETRARRAANSGDDGNSSQVKKPKIAASSADGAGTAAPIAAGAGTAAPIAAGAGAAAPIAASSGNELKQWLIEECDRDEEQCAIILKLFERKEWGLTRLADLKHLSDQYLTELLEELPRAHHGPIRNAVEKLKR